MREEVIRIFVLVFALGLSLPQAHGIRLPGDGSLVSFDEEDLLCDKIGPESDCDVGEWKKLEEILVEKASKS